MTVFDIALGVALGNILLSLVPIFLWVVLRSWRYVAAILSILSAFIVFFVLGKVPGEVLLFWGVVALFFVSIKSKGAPSPKPAAQRYQPPVCLP